MKHLLVETKSGKIQGFEEHGLTKFLGIPYAQKPVNELRFKGRGRRKHGEVSCRRTVMEMRRRNSTMGGIKAAKIV